MMNLFLKKFILPPLIVCLFFCAFPAEATEVEDADFNPSYIISDDQVLNYQSMSLEQIKIFLNNKGGYLANYSCANPDGKLMTAAEIIYDRATTNQISPKFLIVLLQKEQGLIEDKNPKQSKLDWATGYGCPDSGGCNARWQGFWKQVNSASLQFRDYIDNPQLYTYKAGQTYTFYSLNDVNKTNGALVTPVNRATAALYNYTPHVFNGNYNFYKLWKKYFGSFVDYPDGSLLQASGEPGIWLIQNGMKRPFTSKGALTSRFDIKKVIVVSKDILDNYGTGDSIKFPQYSLVKTPDKKIYLLVDDKKRLIADTKTFKKIGFNPEEVIEGGVDDLKSYADGQIITATSTAVTGELMQNKKTGGVYWVYENKKAPIIDRIFLTTKFKNKKIKATDPKLLDGYETTSPVLFENGELLKTSIDPGVYLIANGEKRAFTSGELFEKLGYKWENIVTVSAKILYLYPLGQPVIGINQ
ncbi:MAG: hypothetical protein PHT51_01850 [Patescibacteria group bacterium]|nr:hypothetical protein [Patescibacteria group bacterium]MDD4610358.1 hypothetical protein [Patescibacteria group bacterium]